MNSKQGKFRILSILVIVAILLAACTPAQSTPVIIKETVEVKSTVQVEVNSTVEVVVVATPEPSALRQLSGKVNLAANAIAAVPGMPETDNQRFWRQALTLYKVYQPNVEVVLEDVPADGGASEAWCNNKVTAKQMPDLAFVAECNYFRPTIEQVRLGLNIATDFKPFEEEISPYSGKPWKEDWANDFFRTGRCTEGGAYDMWTCQTNALSGEGIWVNWDILKEFGYDHTFPKNFTELEALSKKINESGKYVAWDGPAYPLDWAVRDWTSLLTMDTYTGLLGGQIDTPANIQASNVKIYSDPLLQLTAMCDKSLWSSNNKGIQEALRQVKRWTEMWPGGSAYFGDPTRPVNGEKWYAGQAAFMYHGNWAYGSIRQAMKDGVFTIKDWGVHPWPQLTEEDLFDKSVEIAFGGTGFLFGGGGGDIFAPTPNVRISGEDANVDLIVRDFFQFMSSAQVATIFAQETGNIPLNPAVFTNIDPRLEAWLTMRDPMYDGVTQPLATFMNIYYNGDPEIALKTWLMGGSTDDLETVLLKADENSTRELVRKAIDYLPKENLTLPAVCEAWK